MGVATVTQSTLGTPTPFGGRWLPATYYVADVYFVFLSAVLVYSIRFGPAWIEDIFHGKISDVPQLQYFGFLVLYACVVILFCQTQDLYWTPRDRSSLAESLAVAKAVILANAVFITSIYIAKQDISRSVIFFTGFLNIVTLAGWRAGKRLIVLKRAAEGLGVRNVLIIGTGPVAQHLTDYVETNKHLGLRVKGFIERYPSAGSRVLGGIAELSQIVLAHFIDEILITPPADSQLLETVILAARRRRRVEVKIVPELFHSLGRRASLQYLGDCPVLPLHWEPIPVLGLLAKRLIDIVLSGIVLLLLSPVLLLIVLAIRLDSRGPVLYCSQRVGKKGRTFTCYKFRTMVDNADALKDEIRHLNQRHGAFFKIDNDPRITRVGVFLRKYSLDELPQFWNVLKGEMSMVGPRPHPMDDFRQYSLEHLRRLDVIPGITGLWQVKARRDPSFETAMAFDLKYIEDWSLWMDLKILLATAPVVLKGLGQ